MANFLFVRDGGIKRIVPEFTIRCEDKRLVTRNIGNAFQLSLARKFVEDSWLWYTMPIVNSGCVWDVVNPFLEKTASFRNLTVRFGANKNVRFVLFERVNSYLELYVDDKSTRDYLFNLQDYSLDSKP